MSSGEESDLQRSNKNWEVFAQEDPLWAILTDPSRQGSKWTLEEFFATGVGDANDAVAWIEGLEPRVRRRRVLDFGCGVGRVTRALRDQFRHAVGVDAAPTMVAEAKRLNAGRELLDFFHCEETPLPFPDGTFDLVHSCLVLQHIPVEAALAYIADFVRVMDPGGAAVFGVPARFAHAAESDDGFTRFDYGERSAEMEMHCIPVERVAAAVEAVGARVMRHEEEVDGDGVVQVTYLVRHAAAVVGCP